MTDDARLQADIEALRPKFPDTQDLYREVCTILFFRYGITPTANKLYQLVRKGSMSAPAEALARFWETLREKSRVRIEHPDIPEALRDAAGELTAKLWEQARTLADEAGAAVRLEAMQQMEAANQAVEQARQREALLSKEVSAAQAHSTTLTDQIRALEQRLAHDEGLRLGLVQQMEQLASQRQELANFVEAARAGEQRASDEQRRLLLEVDRERGLAARLQKEIDALKSAMDKAAKSHVETQAQTSRHVDELRQHCTELEIALASLKAEHAQMQKLAASDNIDRHQLTRLRSVGASKASRRRRPG
ncbi:MAG: DNA-binding protein [Gammaproteobacteria bacterium]|nr:DNA-binding protein [Gammaproteobacteria bacterium]